MSTTSKEKLMEVARRIREMREIYGISIEEMAEKTEVSREEYVDYEAGTTSLSPLFISAPSHLILI